jgi:hypothetical protein
VALAIRLMEAGTQFRLLLGERSFSFSADIPAGAALAAGPRCGTSAGEARALDLFGFCRYGP